jgi:flagellar motor switch protein FliN/FliY
MTIMATDLKTIVKLQVPVIVQVGTLSVPMDDILGLTPGAILELGKPAEEELTLMVNNKPIGTGEAVKVGENFGIRITQIGSAEQRVRAMGSETN